VICTFSVFRSSTFFVLSFSCLARHKSRLGKKRADHHPPPPVLKILSLPRDSSAPIHPPSCRQHRLRYLNAAKRQPENAEVKSIAVFLSYVAPEHMNANSGPLGAEDSAIFSVGDCSKKVEIFLEEPGGEIHPIFDMEDKYLQQRYTAPTQNAFK
jgi:hypothetical protein